MFPHIRFAAVACGCNFSLWLADEVFPLMRLLFVPFNCLFAITSLFAIKTFKLSIDYSTVHGIFPEFLKVDAWSSRKSPFIYIS